MRCSFARTPFALFLLFAAPIAAQQTANPDTDPVCSCPVRRPELPGFNPAAASTWGATRLPNIAGLGRPMRLTWAFVVDGSQVAAQPLAGLNAPAPSTMQTTFNATLRAQIATYIAEWGTVFGVTLTQVTESAPGIVGPTGPAGNAGYADIRISAAPLLGVQGWGYFPAFGGDIILNSSSTVLTSNPARLRNVIRHEIGHALGLDHVCPSSNSKIMEPASAGTASIPLSQDEVLGGNLLYGDRFERIALTPTGLPVLDDTPVIGGAGVPRFSNLTPNVPVTRTGHTIDPGDLGVTVPIDIDFFDVTVVTPGIVRITVTPIGAPYQVANTPANNSCVGVPGALQQPIAAGDLSITIAGPVPTVINANPGGVGEVVEFPLAPGARGWVSVTGFFGPIGGSGQLVPQQYRIAAELHPQPTPCQQGAVVTAAGAQQDSIFITGGTPGLATNGGLARTIDVVPAQSFGLQISQPAQNNQPANFVLWADATVPLGAPFPFGATGTACFNPFGPSAFLLADTFGVFGVPLFAGVLPAAPTTTIVIPPLTPTSLSVQGAIEQTPGLARVTNNIILRVRPPL